MKKMLITGSNRGLGAACVAEFTDYELITVSRHEGSTIVGDLRDRNFLEWIVETHNPDVLINNAGIWSADWSDQIDVNLHQSGFLATQFYKKMPVDSNIINMSSTSANLTGWQNMTDADMFYIVMKSALKNLSKMLSRSKRRPVRVTSLEPAFFLTDFANIKTRWENKGTVLPNHYWYRQNIMTPEHLAKTIRWIIEQPPGIEIASLEILNSVLYDDN